MRTRTARQQAYMCTLPEESVRRCHLQRREFSRRPCALFSIDGLYELTRLQFSGESDREKTSRRGVCLFLPPLTVANDDWRSCMCLLPQAFRSEWLRFETPGGLANTAFRNIGESHNNAVAINPIIFGTENLVFTG